MSRETENVLLLLVGLSTAMIIATGTYNRYVKPSLLPWLVAAAVLLVVLALAAIIRDIRRGPVHHDGHVGETGHRHRPAVVWLLVLPIALMVFVVPPALGARTKSATVVAVSTEVQRRAFPPLPAERAPEVSLKEVLRRASTDSAGTLNGRLITVTGFTLADGDAIDLGRVYIICCAADGRLARVHLSGPALATAASYPEETWLQVEGMLVPGSGDSSAKSVPTLTITSVTPIEPPENSYAY